jgi:uncharacterized membrane protein
MFGNHLLKAVTLLVVLVCVHLWLGFKAPRVHHSDVRMQRHVSSAWTMGMLVLISGVVVALYGKSTTGTLHPVSLRGLYVVLGVTFVIGALIFLTSLKQSVTGP